MRPADFETKWESRRLELASLHAQVDGGTLCREVLADFRAVTSAVEDEVLTLTEAARRSGYSREHLGRLVRAGKILDRGRPNAPRVRAGDVPRKVAHLPSPRVDEQVTPTSRRQIVRLVVDSLKDSR